VLAIRRLLHPTDFSDPSRPAFELACALARDYGAELVVLHVAPPPAAGVVEGITVELPTGWEEETRTRLEKIRPADPRVPVVHRLEQGDAVREILRVAAAVRADLIVMGTHGRGGLSRLLVGSVAEIVMRNAPCPVLTVRAPLPAGAKKGPAVSDQEAIAGPALSAAGHETQGGGR
jgi:nucleotide-binding universal stress UspA family protein